MATIQRNFAGGLVTARDRSDLSENEMTSVIGGYYKPGDPTRLHKIGGRSAFGLTVSGAKVAGLAYCGFDDAADVLVALRGTGLYTADAADTGTFAAVFMPSISGTTLDAAHADDRWYLVTGDLNQVMLSDRTVRSMGMQKPAGVPALTATTPGADAPVSPVSTTENFINHGRSWDGDDATFSHGSIIDTNDEIIEEFTWAAGTPFDESAFHLRYKVSGSGSGWKARMRIETSNDAGSTWDKYADYFFLSWNAGVQGASVLIDSLSDNDQAKVRVTWTMITGVGVNIALQLHEVTVESVGASDAPAITESGNIQYAVCEYDATRGDKLGLSPKSDSVKIGITGGATNGVSLDFSDMTPINSGTTHWRIYRTAYGGTETQLARVGDAAVADDIYIDIFDETSNNPAYILDEPYAMLSIEQANGRLYFDRDSPPPALRRIASYEGALVGLTNGNPRGLHYSVPGYYESWPDIYVYDRFPLQENDQLVDIAPVGSSLVIGTKESIIRLDGLPQVVGGQFVGRAFQIAGAPGVVGDYAMTAMSMAGEQAVAWISPYGLFVSNGHSYSRISDDIDWGDFAGKDMSGWVLFWDQRLRALWFCYSTVDGAENDRYCLIHMEGTHRKQSGQPKWTGESYGDIACMAGGEVDGKYRRFSGHISNGYAYLEHNEAVGTDASQAYSGSTHIMEVETGHLYNKWREWGVTDARLGHTAFGTSNEVDVAWTVGREASGEEDTRDFKTAYGTGIDVATQKKTQFGVDRSGDYHQIKITHTGTGLGAVQSLTVEAHPLGRSGAAS